ncbi:MAG: zinc ABC transporter solute-binding protein [Rhodospirillaceae bacterium]|jgi:manganese/zinc/iron transport system substrate-binding protein|nr:zinc ABC transporter solute-binding protein [Rhodospirillaceae bacterium]MBT5944874.1 zinc ABC transporter solute-binding protein [Rhodospirillaceae bacterium]MBT6405472.1 zinc ABC transporter solute-binding protein [Rhodospirillaceae bacterium]MBT6535658.1 zinc ABC transporter solute-binding protein [Rhodospirillaceae bacterium]MBT7360495.1 zinc ABC transporter solute-binding protein [Rhodospirillaceae bacterium]
MNLRPRWLIAVVLAAVILWPDTPASAESRVRVVATTGMIADAARQIGGNLIDVQALMGPGVDPHAYRQTRSDIVAMAKADLVLWNGLFLEAQLESFLLNLADRTRVVAVAEAVPERLLIGSDDYENRFDPHLWMDPELWSRVVINVRDALIDTHPTGENAFHANADAYLARLRKLIGYTKAALSSVPAESRVVVSSHDAFNYFGHAYDFDVIGIQGISTESEAGLRRIAELVETLVARDIHAVFVESSVSDRNIRALIEGAAARDHDVVIGGELFSDAMGTPGTYEGTYIGMIDHNATTITSALGGQVPDTGMQGFLN